MAGTELDEARTRRVINNLHATKSMYGSPKAPFWFVGLEGGNHPTKAEIDGFISQAAIRVTETPYRSLRGHTCELDKKSLQCKQHPAPRKDHLPCLYTGNDYDAKWQPTYGGYIKLLLSLTQNSWNLSDVKKYQKFYLGEIDADTPHRSTLLELYPLDCQRRRAWPYKHLGKISGLEFLKTGNRYRAWALESEWQKILKLIEEYQPKYVFIFGKDSIPLAIKDKKLNFNYRIIETKGAGKTIKTGFANQNKTNLVFARHPTGHTSDIYWKNIAIELQADEIIPKATTKFRAIK